MIRARPLLRLFPASWQPYIRHMRLRALPLVVAHFSAGVLLASALDLTPQTIRRWLVGAILWAGFGHSGTLALNSAKGMYRALSAWALTDLAVILALVL